MAERIYKGQTYMIVRYYKKESQKPRIKAHGLSLEEAREHCNNASTKKEGKWFDGYVKE